MKRIAVLFLTASITAAFGTTVFAGHAEPNLPKYSLHKLSIVSMIKDAEAGGKVFVYESDLSNSKLPYYVFEVLANTDVTLEVVSDSGDTVDFDSSNIPEEGRYSFFTVDELLEMTNN